MSSLHRDSARDRHGSLMARRVVSLVRSAPAALRTSDPALDANTYAVAEDLDLVLVLRGPGLELALAAGEVRPEDIAGVTLPPGAGGQDLRGLVESGVRVVVDGDDVAAAGLTGRDLVDGVAVLAGTDVARLIGDADGVLVW